MGPELARSGGEEKYRRPWRESNSIYSVRFQVLTAASMKFRFVFWDVNKVKQSLYTPWRRLGGEEV
jgi:hypothetical protein